jgi:hypothetical protein
MEVEEPLDIPELVESQVLDAECLLALRAFPNGWSGTQSHGLSCSTGLTTDRMLSRVVPAEQPAVVVDKAVASGNTLELTGTEKMLAAASRAAGGTVVRCGRAPG